MSDRKMPIKTVLVKMDGDYTGWQFTARSNCPIGAFGDVASGNFDRIIMGLSKIVLDWNFVDEEGTLMAKPSQETIGSLPYDLAVSVANSFIEETNKLPKA